MLASLVISPAYRQAPHRVSRHSSSCPPVRWSAELHSRRARLSVVLAPFAVLSGVCLLRPAARLCRLERLHFRTFGPQVLYLAHLRIRLGDGSAPSRSSREIPRLAKFLLFSNLQPHSTTPLFSQSSALPGGGAPSSSRCATSRLQVSATLGGMFRLSDAFQGTATCEIR